jgi:integrase
MGDGAKKIEALTAKQQEFLLVNVAGTHKDIVVLMLDTGCRIRELLWLSWGDIHLESDELELGAEGERRRVPLTDRVREMFEGRRMAVSGPIIFPIPLHAVYVFLNMVNRRKGLHVTPMMLRDTYGKALGDANLPVRVVAKAMGVTSKTALKYLPADRESDDTEMVRRALAH